MNRSCAAAQPKDAVEREIVVCIAGLFAPLGSYKKPDRFAMFFCFALRMVWLWVKKRTPKIPID